MFYNYSSKYSPHPLLSKNKTKQNKKNKFVTKQVTVLINFLCISQIFQERISYSDTISTLKLCHTGFDNAFLVLYIFISYHLKQDTFPSI